MKKYLAVVLYFFLAACDQAPTNVENSDTFLITNVNVIPMDEDRVLENRSVLVEGGVITGIFAADQTPDRADAKTIN